jgi:lipoyl(octanoyl) transferase
MEKLRLIGSEPANGPRNMAVDEAIFNNKIKYSGSLPSLRIYTWDSPCITMGYFQKYKDFSSFNVHITRRMTGGLTVVHGNDVSFSFVLDDNSWDFVYDQEKSYLCIHKGIKDALDACGFKTEFVKAESVDRNKSVKNNICVQTFFPYDLHLNNKKIVGSCQRRRGKNLLVQGSIHLPKPVDRNNFYEAWETSLKNNLSVDIVKNGLTAEELSDAAILEKTRYSADSWNKKY